jgi:Icc-related predicted phosphoesterase
MPRIFATSDLHIDYEENKQWVAGLSALDYRDDALILAGDISAGLKQIRWCLQTLKERFARVFFIPGNHDLWVDPKKGLNSLERFEQILALCDELEVETQAGVFSGCEILPLFSWYDFSFGKPNQELERRWADFRNCQWPPAMQFEEVAPYFHKLNEQTLDSHKNKLATSTRISFSHFLPFPQVLPQRVDPARYWLSPVLGSLKLGEQLIQLKSNWHIFGHSHLNTSSILGSTKYLNNAFGYPSEGKFTRKSLAEIPLL